MANLLRIYEIEITVPGEQRQGADVEEGNTRKQPGHAMKPCTLPAFSVLSMSGSLSTRLLCSIL